MVATHPRDLLTNLLVMLIHVKMFVLYLGIIYADQNYPIQNPLLLIHFDTILLHSTGVHSIHCF